jgi:FHS family L-fucose permease-like MFS transporter
MQNINPTSNKSVGPMLILGALFFIFGFVTWLNGTLIQYFKIACELDSFQSLLVAFAFYISYFVMAIPSSWILEKTGFKKGMMLGLIVMGVGTLVFVPAAYTRIYGLFLSGLFIIGTGLSILQTASNPYITIVGPIESAASRISIMGICNKVAGVFAPLILGAVILSDADSLVNRLSNTSGVEKEAILHGLAMRAVLPYICIAIVLAGLALWIRFSNLPEIEQEQEKENEITETSKNGSIFSHSNLVLGVIALFLYVGAEVIAGDTIGIYGHSLKIPLSESKNFTSYTLAAMVIGYIIGIISIPRFISQSKALAVSAVTGILFSTIAIFTMGYTSVLFIALLGLANALMWPAIWPLAIQGLGKLTKLGSAMLIMAIAGGAVMPLVYGKLADMEGIGHQNAYWILVPCYFFILFYAIKNSKQSNIER